MDLQGQLDHLDRLLLSRVTTAFPDLLTDEEKAVTNAYLVLAHAVLEETIEAAFERHFQRLTSWFDSTTLPLESARLLFAMRDWIPESYLSSFKKRDIVGLVKGAHKPFLAEVRGNHGIKPHNIENLARLVGLDWVRFEAELNTQMEDLRTLGTKRGDAGHLSPYTEKAVALSRQDYPENVREWVNTARDAALGVIAHLNLVISEQQPTSLIADWDGN